MKRNWAQLSAIIFSLLWTAPHVWPSSGCLQDPRYSVKDIGLETVFILGSGEDEDLHKPGSFAIDAGGKIYILDSGNSRIRVFSPDGRHEYSFGRYGQGPGELSMEAKRLRILDDGNLYVIDNRHKRISIFTTRGEFLKSFNLRFRYHDILLKNDRYFLSNLVLDREHKPIQVSRNLIAIDDSFGILIEPTPDIINTIRKAPPPNNQILKSEFLLIDNYTCLTGDSKGNIYYAQSHPYHIVKYDVELNKAGEIIGDPGFDTHFPLKIEFFAQGVNKRVTSPPARVYGPIMMEDDRFFIPVLSPDNSFILLDLYDADCRLISRHKTKNIILDPKKREGIVAMFIDPKGHFYCLVVSAEEFPRFHKYKLVF